MGHITGSLEEQGALIDVTVGVSKAFREAMKKVDLDVQPSRATKALIDGGASHTLVDVRILAALGLSPLNGFAVQTPTTGPTFREMKKYAVTLGLVHSDSPVRFPALEVGEADFSGRPYQVIIGRDVLSKCVYLHHGPAGFFSLSF